MAPCPDCRGYVLITSMVFLVILTMVGVTAVQNTALEQKMSANVAFHTQSREDSESGRNALSSTLYNHLFYRGWPAPTGTLASGTFTLPTGLTIVNGDTLYTKSEDTTVDATFQSDTDGNGTADSATANLYIHRMGVVTAPGAGASMVAGYEGMGKSAAGGGSYLFLQLKSRTSGSAGQANSQTGSHYRAVINN